MHHRCLCCFACYSSVRLFDRLTDQSACSCVLCVCLRRRTMRAAPSRARSSTTSPMMSVCYLLLLRLLPLLLPAAAAACCLLPALISPNLAAVVPVVAVTRRSTRTPSTTNSCVSLASSQSLLGCHSFQGLFGLTAIAGCQLSSRSCLFDLAVGSHIMVSPVLYQGHTNVTAYFPQGDWCVPHSCIHHK